MGGSLMSSYNISKKTVIVLVITVISGFFLYNIAPPDIEPGEYTAELMIETPSITLNCRLNLTMVESGDIERETYHYVGQATNITVTATTVVPIAPDSPIRFEIDANGVNIRADSISIHFTGDSGLDETLRPTRQEGQTFIIEYQPLVRSKAAVMILGVVAILWFSEGISLVATSVLIPTLIVLTDIGTPTSAFAPFFSPAVALIFGGFLIGRALSKYELDKRLALMILSRSSGSGSGLLITVMGVTSFLSMWISNTASAAIMIPIALAVISRIQNSEIRNKYGKALVLGVAYSATIGGVASLVGSPPNPLAATYINSFLGIEFNFISWIPYGLPVVLIMLPLIWQWLMFRFKIPKDIEEIKSLKNISEKEYLKLGPMTTQQKLVVVVFSSVVLLWLTEGYHGISSSIVAVMGGLALLVLRLVDETDVSSEISWSSLLILGSGIVLGNAMIDTGVSAHLAFQMTSLGMFPALLIVVIIGAIAVLLTMVASNTGAAVILIPIAIPLATSLGMDPLLLTMVIAIGVSMDFALPTGTPPSTIAYSTGEVEMNEMVSTGLVIDLVATLVLTVVVVWIWRLLGLVVF
ncbi:DASS family sodium-coupled anion symporter [Candidatus Thorarchaeota archaeon]|nr:MAG: DASS family sodium-coupled anion symporter [Candidatus Thorarchaeota archaeon]